MTDIEFTPETPGERLDRAVLAHLDAAFSRTQVQTMIDEGRITVDGKVLKAGTKLRGGEHIRVTLPPPEEENLEPEDIPLKIVHEEDTFMVIDKPAGMVVHPGVGNESGTLVNALLAYYPGVAETERNGIVHRIDKETSGLLVVAKTQPALEDLMAQFKLHTVDKVYLALTERTPKTLTGRIDAPIARDPKARKRMAVVRGGKPAVTEFEVIDQAFQGERALVRIQIETGRTHQIRVHMAFIGAPVVGDRVYGFNKQRVKMRRHFLHAAQLSFDHPETGERLALHSPLPTGLQNVLDKLRS